MSKNHDSLQILPDKPDFITTFPCSFFYLYYVCKNIYSVLYTSNLLFFVTALLPMSRNHDSLQIPDMSKCLLTDTKSHLPRERRCKKHIIRQVSITIKSMKKGFHSFCNGNILINKSYYILGNIAHT